MTSNFGGFDLSSSDLALLEPNIFICFGELMLWNAVQRALLLLLLSKPLTSLPVLACRNQSAEGSWFVSYTNLILWAKFPRQSALRQE